MFASTGKDNYWQWCDKVVFSSPHLEVIRTESLTQFWTWGDRWGRRSFILSSHSLIFLPLTSLPLCLPGCLAVLRSLSLSHWMRPHTERASLRLEWGETVRLPSGRVASLMYNWVFSADYWMKITEALTYQPSCCIHDFTYLAGVWTWIDFGFG